MTAPTTTSNMGADASRGHTPGEWVVDGPKPMEITGDVFRVHDSDLFPMAFVPAWDEPDRSEAEANARLIAAAPDMLAALEDSLPELVALLTHLDDAPELEAKIAKARAAIAKARGAAPTPPAGETK